MNNPSSLSEKSAKASKLNKASVLQKKE